MEPTVLSNLRRNLGYWIDDELLTITGVAFLNDGAQPARCHV